MTQSRQALGKWGEKLAADYLEENGFRIVDRNVRTSYGEIDLVVQRESLLVFVEVKTRSSDIYGLPEEAITQKKRENLIAAAQFYFQEIQCTYTNWRIDVVSIRTLKPGNNPEIIHFKNAIS